MPIFQDLSFLNPNTNQPEVDPYQKLQEMIAGINSQPLQSAKPMGTLERIITSLAQAASVAASPDPGATLSGQLKQKSDERNAINQALQNRQNLVNQATLQAGFQQAEGMAREQAEVRKEGRLFKQKAIEDVREVNLFKNKKQIESDIQLSANKSLLEQNEAFEAANEQARNRRKMNAAVIDLLPSKYKDAALWESNAKALIPNADPALLQSIVNKKSGIDPTPIVTKEQELIVAVNKAIYDEAKEQAGLGKAKIKADIKESEQRGQAALIGANAAMISAKNQSYNNSMQNWATKQKLDIMETQFYKTPSGAIISLEEVNKLPINEKYTTIALPAAENVAEQQKRILQINSAVGQTQQQTQIIQQQLQQSDQLINQIKEDLKTKTPEQVKQQILNSNLPQSEKNRAMEVLGVKQDTYRQATPAFESTRKLLGIEDKSGPIQYNNTTAASAIYGNTSSDSRTKVANLLEQYKKQFPNVKDYTDLVNRVRK